LNRMLLGSIDQGTSSTRFIVFNTKGEVVSKAQTEFPQIHQNPGCVYSGHFDFERQMLPVREWP
jgi:glycerol kinase